MEFNFVFLKLSEWLRKNGLSSCSDICSINDNIFKNGKEVHILKTYKILQCTSLNLSLSECLDKKAINIMHRDDYDAEMTKEHFIVCSRADKEPAFSAQIEILQNGLHANGKNRFFIPHWPQDGIIPRDPERDKIEKLTFFGKKCHVFPELKSERFKEFCRKYGLVFEINEQDWHDYSSTDVVIAVRDGFPFYLDSKPAHKLLNSWIAGVPAILNPEYGYIEAIAGENEVIFVNSIHDVMVRIKGLIDSPDLYNKIVNNGNRRAKEFSFDRIASEWELLLKKIETSHYPKWQAMSKLRKAAGFTCSEFRQKIWGIQVTQYPNNLLRNSKSYIRIFFSAPILCIRQLFFSFQYRFRKKSVFKK